MKTFCEKGKHFVTVAECAICDEKCPVYFSYCKRFPEKVKSVIERYEKKYNKYKRGVELVPVKKIKDKILKIEGKKLKGYVQKSKVGENKKCSYVEVGKVFDIVFSLSRTPVTMEGMTSIAEGNNSLGDGEISLPKGKYFIVEDGTISKVVNETDKLTFEDAGSQAIGISYLYKKTLVKKISKMKAVKK